MNQDYKEISPALLEQAKGSAWSIESMAGHDAEHRTVNYIGSTKSGHIIRDYYRDNTGAWWYKNRAIVDGCAVSAEVYIFGKEIKRRTKKH